VKQKMRIGMLKAVPTRWDLEGNWALIEAGWHEAARQGVDLFMTPECMLDGYSVGNGLPGVKWTPRRFDAIAQVFGKSPYVARARGLCRQYGCYGIVGLTEKRRGKYYNTALLLGRDGELVGRYDKTHCYYSEKAFELGKSLPVFDLDVGRVGICICADRRWPETMRELSIKGAQAILMPTYGMWHAENEMWMRTRSYENQRWGCFCHPHVAFICDPKGNTTAKLQSTVPGVLVEDIDLALADDHMLNLRRPEICEALCVPPKTRPPKCR